jgi:hypothetical protein
MIMKNAMKAVLLTSLFALMAMVAQADPFLNPPETYAPVWYTPFPYQRNIDMGFGTSPVATANPNGIPGAVYEGTLDPSLWPSDYVLLTGSVSWYGTISGITQTGLIGIDNRGGSSTLTGTATFHIDKVDDNLPLKDVWLEALSITGGTGGGYATQVFDPNNNLFNYLGNRGGVNMITTYNGDTVADGEWQTSPNPVYETVKLTFSVPAGGYELIDQYHIATECVPEPATFSLLALGGLALLWRRRS